MRIIDNILGFGGHGYLNPSYVVIHETAGPGAPAVNLVSWWAGGGGLPVHYVGDWTGDCYYCVPEDEVCWQVGNGNPYVVGIELCHATNYDDFCKVWDLGVEWAVWQLQKRGWGTDRLISHYDCISMWGGTDHTDPIGYFEEFGRSWEQFVRDVEKRLGTMNGEWIEDEKGWWYKYEDGSYPAHEWVYIEKKWYFFDKNGYMATGWLPWDGRWYYLQPKNEKNGTKFGHMVTGWKKIKWKEKNHWFFFEDSGAMFPGGFRQVDGIWYAFDSDGAMITDDADVVVDKKTGAVEIKAVA